MAPLISKSLTNQRLKAVSSYLQGDILDIGCGYGHLIKFLYPGQSYVGIDGNPKSIEWLRAHYPNLVFYLLDVDTQEMNLNQQFDRILMVALIEHLNHPQKILSQIPAHLKPNGKLIITTPTRLGGKFHALGARLGLVYSEAALDHKGFFDYPDLTRLVSSSGMEIEHYHRFLFGENQLLSCVIKRADHES